MANESVDNFFEGTTGRDNTLVIGGSFETGTNQNLKIQLFTLPIGDVSTSGSVFVVPGVAGLVIKIGVVIDSGITVADEVINFKIGTELIGPAGISIPFAGSGAGDVAQITTSTLNVITATDAIEVVKTGVSTGPSNGVITFEILMS